jgi:uncharacterized protein (DUF2249 family)
MTTAEATAVLDLRGFEEPGCSELVLEAFDCLAPGESLLIEGPPGVGKSRLLARLGADRKGLFEWSPLESGSSGFRVELTRRGVAAGALRTVTEALAWDHDRLDGLERHAFERLHAGDVQGARSAWASFETGLRRHIRFEEDLLFPAFEERSGLSPDRGPSAVMRSEHRDIESLLDGIGRALADGRDPQPWRRQLHALLGEHNLKEERIVYPTTDRLLSPEESDALVARIQAS